MAIYLPKTEFGYTKTTKKQTSLKNMFTFGIF